jgi:hypothetical protein
LRLEQLSTLGREPRELRAIRKALVDGRERRIENGTQRRDRVIPHLRHLLRQSGVAGLRKKRVGLGRAVTAQGSDLCKPTFDRAELFTQPAKLPPSS